jgi:hypothetical protein
MTPFDPSDKYGDWKSAFVRAFHEFNLHDSDAREVFERALCPVCSGPMSGKSPLDPYSRICSACGCRVEFDVEEIEVQNSCYTQYLRGIQVLPAEK